MKTILELENSTDILERQEYAMRLRGFIKKWEEELPEVIKNHETYPELKSFDPIKHKEAIKNLKIKLSNYDIYNQKLNRICAVCKETVCICEEVGIKEEKIDLDKLF